jgi:hypothetical protein
MNILLLRYSTPIESGGATKPEAARADKPEKTSATDSKENRNIKQTGRNQQQSEKPK